MQRASGGRPPEASSPRERSQCTPGLARDRLRLSGRAGVGLVPAAEPDRAGVEPEGRRQDERPEGEGGPDAERRPDPAERRAAAPPAGRSPRFVIESAGGRTPESSTFAFSQVGQTG